MKEGEKAILISLLGEMENLDEIKLVLKRIDKLDNCDLAAKYYVVTQLHKAPTLKDKIAVIDKSFEIMKMKRDPRFLHFHNILNFNFIIKTVADFFMLFTR